MTSLKSVIDLEEGSDELKVVLENQDKDLRFPRFSHEIAWHIGTLLRERFIEEKLPRGLSAAIQIRSFPEGSSKYPHILFATTVGEVAAGIGRLVAGKANAVQWFGKSTYLFRVTFKKIPGLCEEFGLTSPEFFLHGGGIPIKLENHDQPVGVIVVSGMPSQAEDHQLIADVLYKYLPTLKDEAADYGDII